MSCYTFYDLFDLSDFQEVTGNPRISDDEAAKLIALRIESTKTRNYGYYRVGALRNVGGARKVVPRIEPKLQTVRELVFFDLSKICVHKLI